MTKARPLEAADFAARFDPLVGPGAPETWLAAISGGPDSVALLLGLARWAAMPGPSRPRILTATIDHGLRPGARAEAEQVAALAADLGLPHHLLVWSPPGTGRVSQARARLARYDLLAGCAEKTGASALVTAHTRDDQAETLLMRAAAGSGLTGLGAMRVESRRGGLRHLRPLLDVPKAALVATCRDAGRSFAQDPTNRDPAYARPRWRALMPTLAAEGLTAARLAGLATRLARADDALTQAARNTLDSLRGTDTCPTAFRLDFERLAGEPQEIVIRVLALALDAVRPERPGAPLRLARLEACAASLLGARLQGSGEARTLAGCRLVLDPDGVLRVTLERPRRRGAVSKAWSVTEIAAGPPHSLGIAPPDA